MNDKRAKNILRRWPNKTNKLFPLPGSSGFWLRAQPKIGNTVCPYLKYAGSKYFKVQPDGMWIYLSGTDFADAICVEVSNSVPNLNDKRSRYLPSGHSMLLVVPLKWLNEKVGVTRGLVRWKAFETLSDEPTARLSIPVRHLRVLYALNDKVYQKMASHSSPAGHEYYCLQSSLKARAGQQMQKFLKSMTLRSHFLTRPYRNG